MWVSFVYIFVSFFLDSLPIYISTEHWVWFPQLNSRLSSVVYFIHGIISMYVSIPISQSTRLPTFPHWSSYVCSLCLCLHFCFTNKRIMRTLHESDHRCGAHTIDIMKGAETSPSHWRPYHWYNEGCLRSAHPIGAHTTDIMKAAWDQPSILSSISPRK